MRVKLKQLRKEKGWTQAVAAQELKCSLDYVKSVETGRCTPSLPMAIKIAHVFGCESIDEIIAS